MSTQQTADVAYRAMVFARSVHKDQVRKYTQAPYGDHLAEVAGIVATVGDRSGQVDLATMVAVAWLHDCVEDQGVTPDDLAQFGDTVMQGVMLLSDLETGNRATRKAASCERLGKAPGWVQTIKCADLISNTSSIVQHDPDFAVVYLAEKRMLLASLSQADCRLRDLAKTQSMFRLPPGPYSLRQVLEVDGRLMQVESYSHTGTQVVLTSLPSASKFERIICLVSEA